MNVKMAQQIVSFFDAKVMAALEDYVKDRTEQLNLILQKAATIEEVKSAQGAVNELRILKKIRDEAVKIISLEK